MKLRNTMLALCLISTPAYSNGLLDMLIPTPLSIVMGVGKWITRDEQPIYYVQVKGSGRSIEEARENAFNLAIDKAVGSLVVKESSVSNQAVLRNNSFSYSSAYISDWKQVSKNTGATVELVLDVWVAGSNISQRIISQEKQAGSIDGDKIIAKLDSIEKEQHDGDKLLQTVLHDFPYRAYNVKLKPAEFEQLDNREIEMKIYFDVQWNDNYVSSLKEVFTRVGQSNQSNQSYIVKERPGKFGRFTQFFLDEKRYQLVYDELVLSEPVVKLQVFDKQQKDLLVKCYSYQNLRENMIQPSWTHHNTINVYEDLEFYIPLYITKDQLSKFSTYTVTVTRTSDCL